MAKKNYKEEIIQLLDQAEEDLSFSTNDLYDLYESIGKLTSDEAERMREAMED